jgi:antirestriction protein ArdC
MATQVEIRESITTRIVQALKSGTAPWRRPWSDLENAGSPANVVSRRPYTGVNTLLLQLIAFERGWSSRWWGTFRQWTALGLRVRQRPSDVPPGEWGTKIVFCKPVTKVPVRTPTVEDPDDSSLVREGRYLLLRQFCVFNADQVEGQGVEAFQARPPIALSFENFGPAEEAIAATSARIEFGGGRAAYFPAEDFIRLPPKESFISVQEYYATAFHELAHWTGHGERLGRLNKNARFGDSAYAFEELVAEIAGCFACNEVGIPQSSDLTNHTAYLASWLRVLQNDPTSIFTAGSQASAATDFILSFGRRVRTEEEQEPIAARTAG